LGVRPVYYYEDDDWVLFSSTLAAMRMFPGLDLSISTRGVVEEAAVGSCLFADRTAYERIRCLPGGSIRTFSSVGGERRRYYEWPDIDREAESLEDTVKAVHKAFMDSVRIRLGTDTAVMAFLSGGLDSRCVVGALVASGVSVNTLNFAPAGSQDLVFGERVGQALGCNHLSLPSALAAVDGKISSVLPVWISWTQESGCSASHERLVWSGDGGSVGVGHVYITDEIVDEAGSGRWRTAIDKLVHSNGWDVPVGVLCKKFRESAGSYVSEGFLSGLDEVTSNDPGRSLHLLLMATDQRKHLHSHFEKIVDHGCELQLPFFDREFVHEVLRRPSGVFLRHKFYNSWLRSFPDPVHSIPWQAYPGHEPCNIRSDASLTYQWSSADNSRVLRELRTSRCRRAAVLLFSRSPAFDIVSRGRLLLALLATWSGFRDFGYALEFALRVDASTS
jgi:hypothetical protein